MPAPESILNLVERFETHLEAYRSGKYNETQLRRDFLDPFYEALGWDIHNEQGFAEAYRDVIHEDAIRVGGASKAPDYCFRVGGTRKFFLEAKKPSVAIKEEIPPAYQLRRYAWSAKLPLSVLSDFEELAVYDTRVRPQKDDPAATARIFYCTFREYADKWEWIASIFSRDAVLKGSFDKFAEGAKARRGTATVDDAFLDEIESWRRALAQNLALRNPGLSQRELNFAVQRIIDRVIFLRICEDRGIEDYGRLQALQNGVRVYPRLCELFQRADDRYNSGLFHFSPEKGRHEEPDELTLDLEVDDRLLRDLLRSLYYPESPYEFSVLPADILGQVYERFLGKTIRLTAGHRAVVEDKPEVKKAGGVYYTPTYVVDYIVKNTVGKLLEGRRPAQAARLKILDPACGSGSFLIGAYQYLLDWHLGWYTANNPAKWARGSNPVLYRTTGGWRLTVAERKRILLNSIFGVDIDTQAVEVTKLSLLLKVLEGETEQTLQLLLRFSKERALPDLGDNVKCGNSLISSDFYEGQQLSLLDDDERLRINAFDWQTEFPETVRSGGFDAVIGNPPYIPIETMLETEKVYYQNHHPQLERKYDSSIVFTLAMLFRLKKTGLLGFISSLTWQTGENYSKLREMLFTKAGVVSLINLPFDVFKNAYVDTGIYILSRQPTKSYSIFRYPKKAKIASLEDILFTSVSRNLVQSSEYKVVLDPASQNILIRVSSSDRFEQLGNFTASTQGLAGNMFKLSEKLRGQAWYPFLEEGQARRYSLDVVKRAFTDMSDKPSLKPFYEAHPKLLIRRVISRQDRLLVAYADEKLVFKKDINPFSITNPRWNIFFVLGVLNSRLTSYIYVNTSSIATKDDFRQTTLAELRRLPIPRFDNKDNRHTRLASMSEQMLDLHRRQASARTPAEQTALARQIAATDAQIDRLVYDLYGLTEGEVGIVEGVA